MGLEACVHQLSLSGESYTNIDKAQEQETMAKAENPLTEELAKFVKEKLDEWKVPGVSIGVIDNDQVFTAVRIYLLQQATIEARATNIQLAKRVTAMQRSQIHQLHLKRSGTPDLRQRHSREPLLLSSSNQRSIPH